MKGQTSKLVILITGLVAILIIVGVFVFMSSKGDLLEESATMGDILITQDKDNKLSFYNPEGEELYQELELKSDYVLTNNKGTALFLLNLGEENSVARLELNDGELEYKELYTFKQTFSDDIEIKWDTDFGVIFDKKTNEFTAILPEFFETKTIKVDNDSVVEVWQVSDEGIYYAQNKKINYIDYDGNQISNVSVEETTLDLQVYQDMLIAISEFGSGNGEKTVLTLDKETLLIKDLDMITAESISPQSRYAKDERIYVLVNDETFKYLTVDSFDKTKDFPTNINTSKWIFFGTHFVYTVDNDSNIHIYQTRGTSSLFSLEGEYQTILPLWEK